MKRKMSKRALAKAFQHHVLNNLMHVEAQTSYDLRKLCRMIEQHGAVKIARMLVNPSIDPPSGVFVMFGLGFEERSIERAMLDFARTGLFSESELSTARGRLVRYGCRAMSAAR